LLMFSKFPPIGRFCRESLQANSSYLSNVNFGSI
jgi:hypothetical protein